MGLPLYRFPNGKLETIEHSLRDSGFKVERRDSPGRPNSLRSRDGIASALVFEITEKKDSEPFFTVGSGRGGLFRALLFWPIDRRHVRTVEEHLMRAGAKPVVFGKRPNQ